LCSSNNPGNVRINGNLVVTGTINGNNVAFDELAANRVVAAAHAGDEIFSVRAAQRPGWDVTLTTKSRSALGLVLRRVNDAADNPNDDNDHSFPAPIEIASTLDFDDVVPLLSLASPGNVVPHPIACRYDSAERLVIVDAFAVSAVNGLASGSEIALNLLLHWIA
jgi:hypothetical protein